MSSKEGALAADGALDALSDEKKAQKEAKAAAKKAEKEAKKLKALEKQRKLENAQQVAAGAAGSKKADAKAQAKAKADAQAAEVAAKVGRVRATPPGSKKDLSQDPPDSYHPQYVEAAWYDWWSECGYFSPDAPGRGPDAEPYVIVIPPPNVTGALHIGHALTNAIQDALVRYHRMRGRAALWVPGTDHAGIATQTVVEKQLRRASGTTRHDLGREAFVAEVWKWVGDYGSRIWQQQRSMGISVDWARQAFTMDERLSRAVLEAFVRFHEEGLIYRDNRLVNWCCALRTAVSDIEVDYIDVDGATMLKVPGYDDPVEFGVLISFAYRVAPREGGEAGGEGGGGGGESEAPAEVVVATTRIETMLGDAAVAVHPDDARYASLHGRHVIHPVDGRRLPIILDAELVDMAFGTGAVKITPAHDPNDFKAGQRHGLPMHNIFDDVGCINERGGSFAGQPRFVARRTVTEFLQAEGLYRGRADNKMALPLCSRSKDVIEPLLKPQWWVDCKEMAAGAAAVVRDGRLQVLPRDYEAVWLRWLDNIQDWCISRQLWWGHRIPAWYVRFAGEDDAAAGVPGAPSERSDRWVVGRDATAARTAAEAKFPGRDVTLARDEDVLDTWFSSGLFPFSVFGWPDSSAADLSRFYPTSLLETGHDILFFWVARMVMMGMRLTGELPFSHVYLHAMVRDAHGRKMSKSLGNVINPLDVIRGISLEGLHSTLEGGNLDPAEVVRAREGQRADFPDGIEECGTDALRFALCAYTAQGRNINLDIKRVVAYRHWCNKLWNAIKFAMRYLGAAPTDVATAPAPATSGAPLACRWILSRLDATAAAVEAAFAAYEFAAATQAIYAFWQYDVCDNFIEMIKPAMRGEDEGTKAACTAALYTALEAGLRLLHPFMPFVTEELWQRLPRRADGSDAPSIMLAPYPRAAADVAASTGSGACAGDGARDEAAEAAMAVLQPIVREARSLRTLRGIKPNQTADITVACTDAATRATLAEHSSVIATLVAGCGACDVAAPGAPPPHGCAPAVVDSATTVYLHLAGLVDPAAEAAKLEKRRGAVQASLAALRTRMALPMYDRTPEAQRATDAAKAADLEAEVASVGQALASVQALAAEL